MAADMLVKLYEIQVNPDLDRRMAAEGVTIRRALVPELSGICAWIEPRFGAGTLADGTLAGADIDMLSCVRYVHEKLDQPLEEALRMASLYPAEAIGASSKGSLAAGQDADFVVLEPDLDIHSSWIAGTCVFAAGTEPKRAFA